MRKITNLLVCLMLAVLASTNVAWATPKVKIIAVDGSGSTTPINGKVYVSTMEFVPDDSKYRVGQFSIEESDDDDFYIFVANNDGWTFTEDDLYADANCTRNYKLSKFMPDYTSYEDGGITYYEVGYQEEDEFSFDKDGYLLIYAKFTYSGGSSFTPEYYKVRIVPRKHATGSSTMSNGGGRYYVSKTSSSSTWQTFTSGWTSDAFETGETNIVDFYLKAQTFNNNIFEGWYTDASCTDLISTGTSYHYTYTQADLDVCDEGGDDFDLAPRRRNAKAASGTCPPVQFTTKSASSSAVATTIYAKFRVFEPDYYKVRAQVVSPDGNTGGQVYLCDGDWCDDPAYANDHYDSEDAYSSSWNEPKVSVNLYAKAKDGYEFVGWYADAECTTPLSWDMNDYTESDGCTYSYYESDEEDEDLPLVFSTSKSSNTAPLNTVYAKFRSLEPQTYYAQVQCIADNHNPKQGAYGYSLYGKRTTDPIVYTKTDILNGEETAASITIRFYGAKEYFAVPLRGYKFSSWTLTGAHATVTNASSLEKNSFQINVTTSSTNELYPETATLTANYTTATTKTITIAKNIGQGTVTAKCYNFAENADHTGLEFKEFPLGTVGINETNVVYDVYETDTICLSASPAEGYRFKQWRYTTNREKTNKSNPYKVRVYSGADVTYTAEFDQLFKRYYTVSADATAGGSVHVNFTGTDLEHAATTASGNSWWRDEGTEGDTTVTVYYKAIPAAGYEFVQWEENGNPVAGANAEYSRTLTATGTDSENPTTLSLHAVFRQESADEAQVIGDVGKVDGEDQGDGVLFSGTFAGAYEFAKAGHTIVLSQNVTLAAPVTINKNITIDFNNFKLSGTNSALVTIPAGKTVIFEDNSAAGFGGIEVTVNTTEEASAVQVNGTLSFMRGVISCENTNTSTTAQIEAIAVKNGATLNMQGGTATANANQIAVGVSVETGGTALLETGAVNATAGTKAYGVLSNAGTTTTTWNIAINATVSGSSAEANGLRILNAHGTSATNIVSGGTTTATASAASAKAYAIYVENSPVTISGNMAAEASAVTTTNAYAVYVNGANADVTVETGRFKTNNTQDITRGSGIFTLEGGYYVHENGLAALMAVGVTKGEVPSGTKFHQEGYRFVLSNGDNPNYVVATANGKNFSTLEDAILYANNNAGTEMTILMKVPEYTLPAGTYTIPANATLLLPKDAEQTTPMIIIDRETSSGSKPSPSVYQTLTLASGAHLYVHGNIEVGGRQHIYGTPFTGCPVGPYCSLLSMESGSQITLSDGANLYAWGFVQGQGEIDVRRGGTVHEQFQISDFKGGSVTYSMNGNEYKTFPLMSYFIQNVEVGTTYRPGAHLLTYTGFVSAEVNGTKIIGIEGEAAMFIMKDEDDSEDTWVRKWYDVSTDQQVYEVNNAAQLSQLELDLLVSFNSGNYDLPITNNMKIHLLSGEMEISEDAVALPGSDIEVNKLSTLVIKKEKRVSMLDSDEWGNYLYNNALGRRIKFRPGGVPTVRDISSAAGIGDAKLNIHGTLDVRGSLYTSAGGASIYSTNEDAGTIIFSAAVPTTESQVGMVGKVHKLDVGEHALVKYGPDYSFITTSPALLTNAETKTPTSGLAAGTSYCYIDNAWRNMVVDECAIYDEAPDPDVYYAKPKEFVALASGEEDETTHLYTSQVGNRSFITTLDRDGNCQWWEVEPVPGHDDLVHCIHPENDVYYYYNTSEGAWMEKRFSVTWKNWDGSVIDTYEVRYGSQPKYLGSTPTREKTDYYTYDFAGWSPALTTVTADATYTAQFSQTDRKYLITFNDGTNDIETQYLHMGDIPVCVEHALAENEEWTPAISPVTGDATYTLTSKNVTGPFTITFVNWNGAELQSSSVETGETPVYSGAMPVKPSLGDENYTFIGWTPSIVAASANAVYMATFEATQVTGLNIVDAQTIADTRELTDLRVTTTGTLNVTGRIDADNFYLESNGSSASGQIVGGEGNITADHIYFDYKVNAKNHKWYAVAVPWQVSATNGISVNGKTLVLGKDFDIIYYDGARRAAEGKKKCWKYVENDGDKTLQPGRLYMIGLMMDAPTIRFEKKDGASLLTTSTSVSAYAQTTGDVTDANWNGVANPALFHAFVNAGALVGQVYNPETNSYDEIPMNTTKMVVGQGAFVQAPSNKAITVTYGGAYAAPRRARAEEAPLYDVRIAPAEGNYTDRLFVRVEDEKEADTYVIGKDLAKLGVSKSVAQMWINRYNTELCLNTMTMENGVAEYPLSIFAPKAGEYTITNEQSSMSNEYTLYLTRNGEAIWNLSDAAYTGTFDAGTTSAYGLRISARAPQITTGIDEAVVDAKGETRKVLIDNQVFIIRGENVYSVDGQLVK